MKINSIYGSENFSYGVLTMGMKNNDHVNSWYISHTFLIMFIRIMAHIFN